MHEIDFLPVENEDQDGGKSGDAIAVRFTVEAEQREAVIVIDGGFSAIGDDLVEHVRQWYDTDDVDLVISTHPDADHINGLSTVVEELNVGELLIHRPGLHARNLDGFSNIEAVRELLRVAQARGTTITEPFTGLARFNGQLLVLGPTMEYYEELLAEQLSPTRALAAAGRSLIHKAERALRLLTHLPDETLTDLGETSPRNNSSVITLLRVGTERLLFTGDAGMPALEAAADHYEEIVGPFGSRPLSFFQAPHHGSKRNLGPTVLNRILGKPGSPYGSYYSMISSAKASDKHPSPKVVNALSRRGCSVIATEGKGICTSKPAVSRQGWERVQPMPPLVEDDDED